jgi:hypothetical protein
VPSRPRSPTAIDISADDYIEIHLDTFDERNRALVFIVNPLGVQADGTKSENGGFIPGSNVMPGQNDLSADFVWQSSGHLFEGGYEVEVRIPFSSLRYRGAAEQRWGLQIDRRVQHNGYEQTWTPAKRASASFIGQAGRLVGLRGMRHGEIVELNPELTNTVTGTPCCDVSQREWQYASKPRVGGNVRWGIGSNFVLNGTVRPDFSQVEADATQIAADERFALFYAERRPFFVEALDQFNVPNTLVYTRTIVRPDGALKLTASSRARTSRCCRRWIRVKRASTASVRSSTSFGCGQNFGDQSLAGLLYSDRVPRAARNRVFGGDTRFVFPKFYVQFQAVESMTHENGTTRSGPMWEASSIERAARSDFIYNIIGIDPDFRADNGFVPRVGFVRASVSNRYTPIGNRVRWSSASTSSERRKRSGATTTFSRRRACSRIRRR